MSTEAEAGARKLDSLARDSLWFLLGALVVVAIVFGFYYHQVGRSAVPSPEVLGQAGDFIGGVLNPVLGFFSLAALVITVVLTRRSIDASTRALELTEKQFEARLEFDRKEARKADLFRMIEFLARQLNDQLARKIGDETVVAVPGLQSATTNQYLVQRPPLTITVEYVLGHYEKIFCIELEEDPADQLAAILRTSRLLDVLEPVADTVRHLTVSLKAYEALSGDLITTRYFQRQLWPTAQALSALHVFHDVYTHRYLAEGLDAHGSAAGGFTRLQAEVFGDYKERA